MAAKLVIPVAILCALVVGLFLWYELGGSSPTVAVTSGSYEWGGYRANTPYEIIYPVFIADVPNYSEGVGLAPEDGFEPFKRDLHWAGPVTAQRYRQNPGTYPEMMGLLEPGTVVRTTKLTRRYLTKYDVTDYTLYGVIESGEWSGTTVDMTEISLHTGSGKWPLKPNPGLLRPVNGEVVVRPDPADAQAPSSMKQTTPQSRNSF